MSKSRAKRHLCPLGGGSDLQDVSGGIADFDMCVHTLRWFLNIGPQGAPRSIKRIARLHSWSSIFDAFLGAKAKHEQSVAALIFKRFARVFENQLEISRNHLKTEAFWEV